MNRKSRFLKVSLLGLLSIGTFSMTSCDEETAELLADIFGLNSEGGYYAGYNFQDENLDQLEDDINLASMFSSSSYTGELPKSVDVSRYLPPIGDQGQYGTCVAWATAYNCRTYLNAKTKNLSKSDLQRTSNQFSPKDLFWSIDNNYKGSNCGGTNFEYAFDQMVKRGVATMSTVPYESLGTCSSKPSSSWSSEAGQHKIKSYREIKTDATTIKQYLAEGKLVVFGAELGDEFMMANSGDIIYTQTSFKYTGQHAYHAMVLSGYDDNKGTNGAFRVVNSWGTSWGDNGYVWVDQKFFCSGKFCYCAFVAYDNNENPEIEDNQVVNPTSGYDLISSDLNLYDYEAEDDEDSDDPSWVELHYNVFNAGQSTISASNDWGICLLYYNAYDANDYGILVCDFYSDKFNLRKGESNGNWTDGKNILGVPAQGYCLNNVDVPGGKSVAQCLGGSIFTWPFKLPVINGDYYLVLAADAFDGITESDEDNNYLYLTAENNQPIRFKDGVPQNFNIRKAPLSKAAKERTFAKNESSPKQTVVTSDNVNTYTTAEIGQMIRAHKKSGALSKKAQEWYEMQTEPMAKAKKLSK